MTALGVARKHLPRGENLQPVHGGRFLEPTVTAGPKRTQVRAAITVNKYQQKDVENVRHDLYFASQITVVISPENPRPETLESKFLT